MLSKTKNKMQKQTICKNVKVKTLEVIHLNVGGCLISRKRKK